MLSKNGLSQWRTSCATTLGLAMVLWLSFSTAVYAHRADAPLAAVCPGGAVVYVNQNATGNNSGNSWNNAFLKLQDALALIDGCPTVTAIWVAQGIYYPDEGTGQTDNNRSATFQLRKNVAIYGGFAGGETQVSARNWQTNITVLSGDLDQNDASKDANGIITKPTESTGANAYHVVSSSNVTATASLDGFSITGGRADALGGGIYNSSSSPTLRNLSIIGNYALQHGAGMYNLSSHPVIENMALMANLASVNGGGIYNRNSNPRLTNILISGNLANNQAGAIYNTNSNPTITNATLSGNYAKAVAVMYNDGSSPILTNIIMWSNDFFLSSPDVANSTTSHPQFSYSIVEGAGGSSNWQTSFGDDLGNNLDVDPLFITPLAPKSAPSITGNLRLRAGSPAANAGLNRANSTTAELDNTARLQHAVIDLGAYESTYTAQLSTTATSAPAVIEFDEPITYTVMISNSGNANAYHTVLTDTLPAQVAFSHWQTQPVGAVYKSASHTISWEGTLTAGTAISFTFVTTHTGTPNETVTNTVETDHPTGGASASAAFTVLPLPSVILADTAIQEADEQATFTVTLSAPTHKTVTIDYTTNDASAVAPQDFTATDGNLTLLPGAQLITFTVPVHNDEIDEESEAFVVSLSAPVNATLADGNASATLGDDDTAGNLVTPTTLTVREPNTSSHFTITLTSQPERPVTVGFASSDTTECTVQNSVVLDAQNWRAGVVIPVTAADDDIVDGDQPCLIATTVSSSDSHYHNIAMTDIAVTVQSEDIAGVVIQPDTPIVSEPNTSTFIIVTLTSQPLAPVQINVTSTVTTECSVAVNSVTLTAANWRDGVRVTVNAVDDDVDDGDQTCIVQTSARSSDVIYNNIAVADPPVTVLDNDVAGVAVTPNSIAVSEPNTINNFSLTLTSKPRQPVKITLASTDTGECRISTSSVTLDSTNWNVSVLVPVTAVDDKIDDGDQGCTIKTSVTSSDPSYNGVAADDVAVTVQDDSDTAGIEVALASFTLSEPSGIMNYKITLTSQPVASVVINLSTTDATECSVPASITLTAFNWSSGQLVKVTAVDDFIIDNAQNCEIHAVASSSDTKYAGMRAADVLVTVNDNDTAGVVFTPDKSSMSEKEGSILLITKLTSQPFAPVTINLSNNDTTECTVPSQLTLDSTNWQTGVGITLNSVDDDLDDETQQCTLQSTVNSSDTYYQGLVVGALNLAVTDDETAGIVVTPNKLTISEPDSTADFVVKLTSEPTATVTITLTSNDLSECQTPAAVLLNKNNWRTGASATIQAVDDRINDDARPCTVKMAATSPDGDYQGLTINDKSVTVADNDTAGVVITPEQLTVQEPSGVATFTIALTSEPTATVSVALTTSDADECTMPILVTLDQSNWENGIAVPVTAVDDLIDDSEQHCTVGTTVSSHDTHYAGIAAADVATTVQDDSDTAGVIVGSTVLTVSEPASSQVFTVVLTSEPTAPVTITLTPANSQCSATTALVFTAADWQAPHMATLSAVDDRIVDGARLCMVNAAATSRDNTYQDIAVASVAATVQDDADTPGVIVTPMTLQLSEPQGQTTVAIALTSEPTATVQIAFTSTDPSECKAPAPMSLHALNWQTGVTVTVAVVDDQLDDGTQACPLQLAATSIDPTYHQRNIEPLSFSVADTDIVALQVVAMADVNKAQLGQPIHYTYRVTNTGDVTLTLTAHTHHLGAMEFTPPILAPKAVAEGSAQYSLLESDAPGPFQTNIIVTGTTPLGGIVTAQANTAVEMVIMPAIDVTVQRLGPPQISAGSVVTYQVNITNTGFVAATVERIEGTPSTGLIAADNSVSTCTPPLALAPQSSYSCWLFWQAVKGENENDIVEFTVNVHLAGPLQSTAVLNDSATVAIGGPNDVRGYLFLPLVKR